MGGKGGAAPEKMKMREAPQMRAQMACCSAPPAAFGAAKSCAMPMMAMEGSGPPPPPTPMAAAPPRAAQGPAAPPPVGASDLHQRAHAIAADPTAPLPPAEGVPARPGADGGGSAGTAGGALEVAEEVDYTRLPVQLDAKLEALDTDGAMRPTKISVGEQWTKSSQKALLAPPSLSSLGKDDYAREKQRAFDLLDALSRGGSLPIDCASLHVLLAATHCFDDSLIDTLVVKNVNPIEKLERSSLIVAETIMGAPAPQLIKADAYDALSASYAAGPALLPPLEPDAN